MADFLRRKASAFVVRRRQSQPMQSDFRSVRKACRESPPMCAFLGAWIAGKRVRMPELRMTIVRILCLAAASVALGLLQPASAQAPAGDRPNAVRIYFLDVDDT